MINAAVEGASDVELVRAVIQAAGRRAGRIIAKGGKTRLDPLIAKYNVAARHAAWLVVRDSDTRCPVAVFGELTQDLGSLSPGFLLRIAHPMSEAWLLADKAGFADHFGIRAATVPDDPEALHHPKHTVLHLCSTSRLRSVRTGVVRVDGATGPLYVSMINEFASGRYNALDAATVSPSLARAIERIRELPEVTGPQLPVGGS